MSFFSKITQQITHQIARDAGNITHAATGSDEAAHAVRDGFDQAATGLEKLDGEARRDAMKVAHQAVRDFRNVAQRGEKASQQAVRDFRNGVQLAQRTNREAVREARTGVELGERGARVAEQTHEQALRDAEHGSEVLKAVTRFALGVASRSTARPSGAPTKALTSRQKLRRITPTTAFSSTTRPRKTPTNSFATTSRFGA